MTNLRSLIAATNLKFLQHMSQSKAWLALLFVLLGLGLSPAAQSDVIWVEDAVPAGATLGVGGTSEAWTWITANPAPFSGSLAHQSGIVAGPHQHYFYDAPAGSQLSVNAGDTLFAYVYLDPANPPSQVMLQWNDGIWEHRAYWGSNNIPWGSDGTASRRYMGPLPAAGQWVRLEVPASLVGLEGRSLNGMAFTLYNGRATWDRAGKAGATPPALSISTTTLPAGTTGNNYSQALSATGGTAPYAWSIASGSLPAGISLGASGLLSGTPSAAGTSSFTVRVTDGNGATLTTALSITVGVAGSDVIWVEDAVPAGGTLASYQETWTWIAANPAPFSGSLAHQSEIVAGPHQHYFYDTPAGNQLSINAGETLFAYVYLDPANPPSEVMLQWNDGSWEHRAYWGSNDIPWGVDGTASRRYMGPLPPVGQWVRLEVPASVVGLEGRSLNGMAFTLYNGRATWDRAGKASAGAVNVAPSISLSTPANGSTHVSGQALVITANAADSDGGIASVAFYANSALLHTATSPPYTLTTSLAAGSYSLTAIATDNQGAATTSTPVNITVTPAANIAPTVSMTGPADASSYAPPANITLTATASDSDGSITAVEFYNGATLIGSVTTPPYTATWSNVPLGNYSVRARAVDNQGAATYSNTIAVNVNAIVASGVYYLYADHLNTPRVITDTSNKVVWRWDSDPFGADAANEDPDGDGTKFRYNPRFPGQYFDQETGLHYNYFRDYEPGTGRYVQSDPIGLEGGLNVYGYAGGDPISQIDPFGLANGPMVGKIFRARARAIPFPALRSDDLPWGSGCGDVNSDCFVPDRVAGGNLTTACKRHDDCYDTKGANRSFCDESLGRDIKQACDIDRAGGACYAASWFYPFMIDMNDRVAKLRGKPSPFDAAQKNAK